MCWIIKTILLRSLRKQNSFRQFYNVKFTSYFNQRKYYKLTIYVIDQNRLAVVPISSVSFLYDSRHNVR